MGRWRKMIVATTVMAGTGVVLAAPVEAGGGGTGLSIDLLVDGPDAESVLAGLTLEIFQESGGIDVAGNNCGAPSTPVVETFNAETEISCDAFAYGDYALGLDGVPEGWSVSAYCYDLGQRERIESGTPTFTMSVPSPYWDCEIYVGTPMLALDKVVEGGAATASDFEFEVYDDQGVLVDTGDPIVDPSDDVCTGSLTECEIIALPAGEYTLGEVLPSHGYEVGSVECDSFIDLRRYFGETGNEQLEIIDDEGAAFRTDDGDAYCTVTNVYREGQLIVTASVNNDDGGVAGVEDVSIEVYEADGDTPVIAATACAADGSCLDEMLPIGDYVIGYIGPDGYTREITQSVSLVVTEKVTDDADAAFTAAFGEVVEIEVAIDDPAPEPTTTTTEPATTTTVFDAGAGTLPPTGASSETNTTIAVLAFALIAAGLALVGVRRRTA